MTAARHRRLRPCKSFRIDLRSALLRPRHGGPGRGAQLWRPTGGAADSSPLPTMTAAPRRNGCRRLRQRFATAPDHIIGGRTINALVQNPYAATSQLILDVVYRHFNGAEPGRGAVPCL